MINDIVLYRIQKYLYSCMVNTMTIKLYYSPLGYMCYDKYMCYYKFIDDLKIII